MGNFVLLLVAAAALGGGALFASGAGRSRQAAQTATGTTVSAASAAQLAHSGMNEAAQWLSGQTAMPTATTTYTGTMTDGGYVATAVPTAATSRVTVTAVGTVTRAGVLGPNGQPVRVRHEIEAVFAFHAAAPVPGPTTPPAFMRQAITTGQTFTANGNVRVTSTSPLVNANVYTTGPAQVSGTGNLFTGFLHHSQPITDNSIRLRLEAAFAPNVNPTGTPDLQLTPAITVPPFVASNHMSLAPTANRIAGSITYTAARFPGGTASAPAIYYIGADLTFSGSPVALPPYVVFLVNGNTNISTNVTMATTTEGTSSAGLYMTGTLNINASPVTLSGQIVTGQGMNINGGTTIIGSVTSTSNINFNSGARIEYRPADGRLAPMYASTAAMTPARFRALYLRVL